MSNNGRWFCGNVSGNVADKAESGQYKCFVPLSGILRYVAIPVAGLDRTFPESRKSIFIKLRNFVHLAFR